MLDTIRQLRRSVIFLVLIALTSGIGDKASLCIMPDGDVHLEQNHSTCAPGGMGSAGTNLLVPQSDQVGSRAYCLDVSLGEDASNRHHRGIVQVPTPAATLQEPPLIFALTTNIVPRNISAVPLPQLLSLRSIVLLI
jgi:hypothetical protein